MSGLSRMNVRSFSSKAVNYARMTGCVLACVCHAGRTVGDGVGLFRMQRAQREAASHAC